MAAAGEERAAAEAALAEFTARLERRIARAKWQLENGYLVDAQAALELLDEELEDAGALHESVRALVERLESEALAAELESAAALEKLAAKLYSKGPDRGTARKLQKLAEELAGTPSGKRAAHLAGLAKEE